MRKLFTAALVVVFLLLGCDDSNYRKVVRASAGVSTGLKSLQEANESLLSAGEIDQDTARAIAIGVGDAATINGEIVKQLRQVKTLDPQSVASIAALVNGLAKSLEDVQANGALHIKSDASKAKFNAAIGAVRASVVILQEMAR